MYWAPRPLIVGLRWTLSPAQFSGDSVTHRRVWGLGFRVLGLGHLEGV